MKGWVVIMKISAFWKSSLREIKQSFGRFIAIFAIVALGVGFFAGLKVTRDAMVATTDRYFVEKQFYDFRLMSTLGYDEAGVELVKEHSEVKTAEGAVNFDILYHAEDGSDLVIKAHSLAQEINGVELTAGRMPENDKECIVDDLLFSKESIGQTIKLSSTNAQEDLDHFKYEEYTIVGLCQSSYYIQFERGNSSLGNGTIAGFMYLLPEGFDTDYYTEIFVKLQQNYPLYSEEYDTYIDALTPEFEALAEAAAMRRYDEIVGEAETELADARQELADGEAEGQQELDDAWAELEDARIELEDAEKELTDGWAELADAKQEIANNEQELADGLAALDAREAELSNALTELEKNKEQLEAGNMAFGPAYDELLATQQQLEAGMQQLEAGRRELSEAQRKLADGKKELEEGQASLEEGQKEYEDGLAEYRDGLAEYEEGKVEFEKEMADARAKIADAEQEIREIALPDSYCLGRDTNIGYVCFESDSSIVSGIANVFPVFFFLVAALVCITTMNRMVEEQRTQIGVLKALGYSDAKIMNKYFFYAGSAALSGCALGYLGGSYLFPAVIWFAYGIMYKVDALVYLLDPALAVISLVASLLASVGATWWSCKSELTQVAAQLIRPKAPQAGKRIFMEYLPFIWNRLSFLKKVSVRNIFRYKKRLFMMVFGISGCTALLVTGFGVKDSIANVASQQFGEIQVFDISVDFEEAVTPEQLEELAGQSGVERQLLLHQGTMDLVTEDLTKSVNLVVFPTGSDISPFVNLHTTKNEPVAQPGTGEAVISHKVAEKMGLQVGDSITLRNEEMETITVTISGIHENFVYNYVYLDGDTYQENMGRAPENKTLYLKTQEGVDLHQLSAELMGLKGVLAVTVNTDTLGRLNSMMQSLDLIVIFIILCAAGLAFVVLYNLTNINIMERIREIATIKVLGFYKKETRSYVFRENLMLAFMGSMVGLLLGKALHSFVMSQVDIDMVAFEVQVLPISYLYSVLLTMGFALFVGLVMGKKLDHISMTESLKSVD